MGKRVNTVLNPDSVRPLYRQLAEILREEVHSLPEDSKFHSERLQGGEKLT